MLVFWVAMPCRLEHNASIFRAEVRMLGTDHLYRVRRRIRKQGLANKKTRGEERTRRWSEPTGKQRRMMSQERE
jgi:hypothetical protein